MEYFIASAGMVMMVILWAVIFRCFSFIINKLYSLLISIAKKAAKKERIVRKKVELNKKHLKKHDIKQHKDD